MDEREFKAACKAALRSRKLLCTTLGQWNQSGPFWFLWWSYRTLPTREEVAGAVGHAHWEVMLRSSPWPIIVDTGATTCLFPPGTASFGTRNPRVRLPGSTIDYDNPICDEGVGGAKTWSYKLTIPIWLSQSPAVGAPRIEVDIVGRELKLNGDETWFRPRSVRDDAQPPGLAEYLPVSPYPALLGIGGGLEKFKGFTALESGCGVLYR